MKKALAISGGGSKGAFAVGVIKFLTSAINNFSVDFIVGTSTGSLIAPLAVLGKIDQLENFYTTVTTDKIIIKDDLGNRLNTDSIFRVDPLWELIGNTYTDDFYDELINSGKEIYINTTCLQTQEIVTYTNAADPAENGFYQIRKFINANHFRRAVLASACQPVFMSTVKVNKQVPGEQFPDRQFVDGGVREYIGVDIAIDNGAESIIAILLSPAINTPVLQQYTSLFTLLERTIDIFTSDVGKNNLAGPLLYNKALKYINEVKKKMKQSGISDTDIKNYFSVEDTFPYPFKNKIPLNLHIIRPSLVLPAGEGGLDFDPAEMKNMVVLGEMAMQNYIAGLTGSTLEWA